MRAQSARLALTVLPLMAILLSAQTTKAEIIATGTVSNIENCTADSTIYMGGISSSTLLINNGSQLISKGFEMRASGYAYTALTVEGQGSKLTTSEILMTDIAGSNTKTLEILNGGEVVVNGRLHIAHTRDEVEHTIRLDNGTLTAVSLFAGKDAIRGTGIINTQGWVSSADILFDSEASLKQQFALGQNVALTLDLRNPTQNTVLGTGLGGEGTISICNGTSITSGKGHIGYNDIGHVNITGPGSNWTTNSLAIGELDGGNGTINVTAGATLTTNSALVGRRGVGQVNIDGAGSAWNNSGIIALGDWYQGNLVVKNGGSVNTNGIFISKSSYKHSVVDIKGVGSKLNVTDTLKIAKKGTLNISNGGQVTSDFGIIGEERDSEATINIDGPGSKWTNKYDIAIGLTGSGNMNITNGGVVTSEEGLVGVTEETQETHATSSGSVLVIDHLPEQRKIGRISVDGTGSKWINREGLYLGYNFEGAMTVSNGGSVSNTIGVLGVKENSIGSAKVQGANSQWNNSSDLYVGYDGAGLLEVTEGGVVTNTNAIIGYNSKEASTSWGFGGTIIIGTPTTPTSATQSNLARVDGIGSRWETRGNMHIGYNDGSAGRLEIANGGKVTVAGSATVNSLSSIGIEVSNNDMLKIDGDFTNDGTVVFTARADLAAGSYTPISVGGTWGGSGVYKAFGGTWDNATRQFNVAEALAGQTDQANVIDLATTQRVLLKDQSKGWSVGAAFGHNGGPREITFTVKATGDADIATLNQMLFYETNSWLNPDSWSGGEIPDFVDTSQENPHDQVLSSFDFETTGLGVGEDVLLSFELEGDFKADELRVWHFDGTEWTEYDASDLTVENGWAYFTVDGFSSYALSAVPEPATLSILLIGGMAAIRRRRKAAA